LKDRSGEAPPTIFTIVLLIVLTLLATGLRLYAADAQSLWYDEGFSVYLARMDLAEITSRTAADIQPPLYYYLLHGWIGWFGDGARALRGLSALFGVLTVPLLYAVGWQLFRSRLAGALAALLIAIAPLHVWYGQEIRMYTLLTLLCLLSSYVLLLIVQRSAPSPPGENRSGAWVDALLWLAFTLVTVAALYTHYFAFFILAFQGVYLLLVWIRRGFRPARLLLGGAASGVAIIAAYLPWLPNLLSRYGADVSYVPGQLKLHQALVDIAVFFTGGESISESTGLALAAGLALILLLSLLALLSHKPFPSQSTNSQSTNSQSTNSQSTNSPLTPAPPHPLPFLLLYLLLPPALILALSYNSPKFNARYVMVAHPALLLLLAGGLEALWQRRSGILGNVLRGALAGLALLFLLGVSAYADRNIYVAPDFARADFRGVAHYIQKHIQPDETIILCSGHIFPIFDYYAPGVERHLLPDSPTLDTTRTLEYGIAAELNAWLAGRRGVWLVLWQDDVVDPVGYLTTMLAGVGEEQPVDRTFSQITVSHYRLPPAATFSDQPHIDHPTDFNFGNRLRLLGYSQTGAREATLFWEALQPLDQDYRVSLVLRDPAGQGWGRWDGRPATYLYPTNYWRAGQIVFGRYDLTPVPGAPPGDYGLEVGVYTEEDPSGLDVLDQAGAPQGKRAMLGAVQLAVAAATPDEVELPNAAHFEMGDGLAFLGWHLDRAEAQPGDRLLLNVVWSVEARPQGDDRAALTITDAAGQTLSAGTFPPTNAWHPTTIWLAGQAWRGQMTFRLPIQAQPGEARLSIQLVDAGGAALGPAAGVTTIQVLPTSRLFIPPKPQAPRLANFDDRIGLLGADLSPGPLAPGGVLEITLYWQARVEMDIPYTVFVHLLGPDGQMVASHDGEPAGGTRPTTGWVPGEYVADLHQVPIPADLPPGQYVVEVGLYDAGARGMPRLLILGEGGQGQADRVIFGPVEIR
jgi:mannosyltransferase